MTRTPWGDAERLRAQKLAPGFRLPRDKVEQSQRQRLLAAMVAVVSEQGYDATRVADVVEMSGVSRTAFYRLFANKEDCFVAAVDEIVGFLTTAVIAAYGKDAPWDERLRATFEAFIGMVVDQPAAARLSLLDVYVAGPEAVKRSDQAATTFERLAQQALTDDPEYAALPLLIVRGIIGGIRKVVFSRLRRGEVEQLPELAPELWRWALSYKAPSVPLRQPRVRSGNLAPRFVAHDQVERLCAAMAKVTAEKGYAATTLDDVVAEASASLSTFYAHFETKEEAFLAAFDVGTAQTFATVLPAFQRAPDWRQGVRAVADSMLSYLSAEPNWARLGVVETMAAGPRGMEKRDETIAAFAALLQPGFDEAPDVPGIAAEAIGGAVYELLYDQIRERGPARLLELQPAATFLGLAPFVGVEDAAAIANERPTARRSARSDSKPS
jgi:AcrR family transcriptional regulator